MTDLNAVSAWITDRLPELLREHDVPGAAIAVYADDEVFDFATGVLSTATGVEATTESVFQIGSITKVWTATMVLQLVDDGLVELDQPVQKYLPDFALSDSSAAATLTVRQLLCHTAGFEGDVFTDTGMGDDCVEKYVASLSTDAQLFTPGELFSYNNAGFCVLGRLVEVLREKSYDECLRERLFAPLGLEHAATDAYQAILHRAAVGHLRPEPDAAPVPAPMWALVRSNAPAGAMLAMSPRDLIAFARMHLDGGTASDGTVVLQPDTVAAMRESQVTVPDLGMMGDEWGLGWELFRTSAGLMIGHDGATIGQSAFLRIVPSHGVAVALVTNGGDTLAVYQAVFTHLLRELAGIEPKAFPEPPATPERIDATRYLGTYSCDIVDMTVTQDDDGRIWIEEIPKGIFVELGGKRETKEYAHLRGDTLIPLTPDRGVYLPTAFVGDDGSGRTQYLHTGRAIRRAEPA